MRTGPKTLDVTEQHTFLNELLCAVGTKKQFRRGVRNYTMALLMLEAGLRVGEVVQLKVSNLYFGATPVLNIILPSTITKNKIERTVPVSTRLKQALEEFAKEVIADFIMAHNELVFYSTRTKAPMSTRQVERIFRQAALKALGRPIHPHVLRHTFATKLMRVTDIRTVQELLGHSSVTSTQIYTHPSDQDKRKAIEGMAQPEPS